MFTFSYKPGTERTNICFTPRGGGGGGGGVLGK